MAVANFATGTQSTTVTTEHFLSSPNVVGRFELHVDLVNMVANDVVELRVYKMVIAAGTQRVVYFAQFAGPQPTDALIAVSEAIGNGLTDTNAVRFSLKQTFGTSRNFPWTVVNLEDDTAIAAIKTRVELALPAVAAEAAGGLFTRGTGAGQINQAANGMIDTNPVRLNNVSQSLLDLKDFADDGYDPSTNKVQGVVLTDTVTTYTGNTPQTGDVFPLASTEIADIKAKTDNLPSDPADASVVAGLIAAVESKVDTIDGIVDSILVDTTEIGAAGAGLTVILGRLSPIATKTGSVATDGGNSATAFKTDLTETPTDHFKDAFLRLTSGALINQVKKITAYNGTTKVITVSGGFTATPADSVTFEIVND